MRKGQFAQGRRSGKGIYGLPDGKALVAVFRGAGLDDGECRRFAAKKFLMMSSMTEKGRFPQAL